jgi:L,D-peptidoglycan transpeptidase YkuD (ErfK/YbiS/YcfS/YnhG family)
MPSDRIIVSGGQLFFRGRVFRAATGKGGVWGSKREGDGITPAGKFHLRECWYRPDRMEKPKTILPLREIQKDDGWCDDPQSPHYNSHVKLPFAASHEELWREDHRYDLIIPISYNDEPVVPGAGSAIFMHVAHEEYQPTEGCIALSQSDLEVLLPHLNLETLLVVREG